MRTRRQAAKIIVASLASLLSGCGYATRGLYPEHVQTVTVPIFKSRGLRRDIEFLVTEYVIKAIETQTPYKVVATGGDTELTGVIESTYKIPFGEDGNDNPRGGIMTMNLSVTWIDNTSGKVLQQASQSFTLSDQASYLIDLGQSQATANDKIARNMADYVVSLMQAPW